MTLIRSSSGEQVARALRDALVRGEIAPGARMREIGIAEMFGVSRNTVREGLRLLGKEGLVSHSLHRGVVVMELSAPEIREVYRARRAIEIAGIILAASAPPAWLDRLQELAFEIRRSGSLEALANADMAFHAHIVAAIDSHRLEEQYRNVQAQLRLSRAWTMRQRANAIESYELHQPIVDALKVGDREQATDLLGALNDEGERRLREAVNIWRQDDTSAKVWPPLSANGEADAIEEREAILVGQE